MVIKVSRQHRLLQIAERLCLYRPERMDLTTPVYEGHHELLDCLKTRSGESVGVFFENWGAAASST
jgi:hypothetical protein